MASHQPKAEMLERWGQLCATWKVCFKSGSKNYIIQKKKFTYFQGTCMMNARINFWPLWTFAKNLSSEPIFHLLLDLPLKSLTWTVLKISTRYNRCSKVRFPSNRFPLHPSPSPPGSAATHSKYYGKRIKTIWLSHLLLLDCVALLLVTIHAVSAAQERPSPQHLYALLSCARGLVRLAGPTLVWALHPRAGTGLWYFFRLKTFYRLNSILFFLRSNLKFDVWCYHQKSASSSTIPAPMTYHVFIICLPLYGGLQSDDLKSSSQQPYEVGLPTFPILQRKEGLREVIWFAGSPSPRSDAGFRLELWKAPNFL